MLTREHWLLDFQIERVLGWVGSGWCCDQGSWEGAAGKNLVGVGEGGTGRTQLSSEGPFPFDPGSKGSAGEVALCMVGTLRSGPLWEPAIPSHIWLLPSLVYLPLLTLNKDL